MNLIIDRKGEITLGPSLKLFGRESFSSIKRKGISFIEEIDMNNGWIHRSFEPIKFDDYTIFGSFVFDADIMSQMRFSMRGGTNIDNESLYGFHNAYLSKMLGNPNESGSFNTRYLYSWGTIDSEIDPRSSTAYIVCTWS